MLVVTANTSHILLLICGGGYGREVEIDRESHPGLPSITDVHGLDACIYNTNPGVLCPSHFSSSLCSPYCYWVLGSACTFSFILINDFLSFVAHLSFLLDCVPSFSFH